MYRLYWDIGKASMAPHAVLEETGAPHELVRVDTDKGEQHSAWYLKINPNARVPTLDHDGRITFETAAIILYLADLHPQAKLAPAIGDAARGLYLQWIAHLTNTVQEALMCWFHADYYAPDAASRAAVKAESVHRLAAIWQKLDGVLAPYLLGPCFSAADLFLVMLCRWTRNMEKPAMCYPNLMRAVELVTARPAWQRMMQAEGITWANNAPG
jgi:glutathione S-transferase